MTGDSFSGSSPGPVLQRILDNVVSTKPEQRGAGRLEVLPGMYPISEPVTVADESASDLTIAGPNGWRGSPWSAMFVNDGIPDGKWILSIGDERDGSVIAQPGGTIEGLAFLLEGGNIRGIRSFGVTGQSFRDVVALDPGSKGWGISIEGGAECELLRTNVENFRIIKNPIDSNRGTNHFYGSFVKFKTNHDRPAFVAEGDGYIIDTFVVRGRPNNEKPDLETPTIAATKRIKWVNGEIYGPGAPLVENSRRMRFTNVLFSSEQPDQPAILNPHRTKFAGCEFHSEAECILNDRKVHDVTIDSACEFKTYGATSGEPAIYLADGAVRSGWIIDGAVFAGGDDSVDHDVYVGKGKKDLGAGIQVLGASVANGIVESPADTDKQWNSAVWPGDANIAMVANNLGHNPVGYRYPTPPVPKGTGETVPNPRYQTAMVTQSGGSGIEIEQMDGSWHGLSVDAETFVVPRCRRVRFTDSVPGGWDWYWE